MSFHRKQSIRSDGRRSQHCAGLIGCSGYEFDADVVSFQPRFLLRSSLLTVRTSLTDPVGFPHQIRLAFSQGNRRHRARHLTDPDQSQLLIARWWPLNLPEDVQNTSCLRATPTLSSANTALTSSTLAAFVSGNSCNSSPMSGPAKP